MKGVIAVVMLALGIVVGFTAGMVIRDPFVVSNPRSLLDDRAPTECLQVVAAGEELAQINREYLSLVRDSYLPMLRQQQGEATSGADPSPSTAGTAGSAAPAVDAMLNASQRLADLSESTAAVTDRLNEAKVECRSRVGP